MKNHNVMLLPLAVIGAIVVFCVVFAIVTGVPKRSKRPTISIPTSPQSIGLSREGVSETQPDFLRYGTSREDIRDAVLIDAVKDVPVLKAKYENERMRRLIREELGR